MCLLNDRDICDGTETEFSTSLVRAGDVRSSEYRTCADAGAWEVFDEMADDLRGGRGGEGDFDGTEAATESSLSGKESLGGVGHANAKNDGGGADLVKGCGKGVCRGVREVDGWGRPDDHFGGGEFLAWVKGMQISRDWLWSSWVGREKGKRKGGGHRINTVGAK